MSDQNKETQKQYETPTLKKVGTVADVTRGAAGALPDTTVVGSQ